MPKAEEPQVVVELTHHSIHALRAVNGTIEAGGECILENKPALEALLGAVAPAWKADGIRAWASAWPEGAGWHLSTDTEAMLDRAGEPLRAIAASLQEDPDAPVSYAVCGAGDGGAVTPDGTEKWVLACASRKSVDRIEDTLSELKVESEGIAPAAFARVGAISAAVRLAGKGAVALWDLGTERSFLVLVTANGVEGAVPCGVGLEAIFEAVQAALKLKFRGAGARLFFNEGYDFTEPGPKVGALIGPKLREALGLLPKSEDPPQLACMGLSGKQAWFVREAAAAAGVSPWEPDLAKVAGELGLRFSDDSVSASFTPASAGLLGLLGSGIRASENWRPAWVSAEAPAKETAPAPVLEPESVPEPEPAPRAAAPPARIRPSIAAETAAAPAPAPVRAARPIGAPKPVSVPVPSAPSGAPTPKPWPGAPSAPARAPAPAAAPSFSRPSFVPPPAPDAGSEAAPAPPPAHAFGVKTPTPAGSSTRPPVDFQPPPPAGEAFPAPPGIATPPPATATPPPASATPPLAAATPTPAVTALPFEAAKIRSAPPAQPPEPPRSRVGFYIGLGVAAASVFAAIMVVLEARNERTRAYDLEQQEALAHHVAEQRLKESEDNRKQEAEEARKEMEAAIEITRKQAAEEARREVIEQMETERLAKLPGSLVVATSPTGASVSIDGAAPLKSPVKLEGVAPGTHHVQLSLAGHDPVELDAVIKGSKATDLGTVALASSFGELALSSSPDGLEFAVRSAADPSGKALWTGRTPADLDEVPHGNYVVTFSRTGCHDHVEKVSVEKGVKSPVATKYQNGSLELTSDPSGAWVDKDGIRLGSTPLALHDLTPKRATFELTLPGYDPTPVSCDVPEGDTLKVEAQLLRRDRVFKPEEVKSLPVGVNSPQPVLSAAQRKLGADVLISFIVRSDGSVTDVEVENATDDDIGRRCKAAVESWRFRPATASDDRNVDVGMETRFRFPSTGS
jgi:TonB family protein